MKGITTYNYYCLKCEQTNSCKCGEKKYHTIISPRLRPPKNTKNKARFRKFLDDCPEFVNCISEEQQPMALKIFRKISLFNTKVNGMEWTNIKK